MIFWKNPLHFYNKLYSGKITKSIDNLIKNLDFNFTVYFNSEIFNSPEKEVPLVDRQYALQILFELAMQRGTITAMMEMISLLLMMSDKIDHSTVNRFVT